MPVVVSADEVDAKHIGFKQTYENGSWIDFGEGSLICGFGQFDDDYQVVEGVFQIAFKDFYYEDLEESDDEEGSSFGVCEVAF